MLKDHVAPKHGLEGNKLAVAGADQGKVLKRLSYRVFLFLVSNA